MFGVRSVVACALVAWGACGPPPMGGAKPGPKPGSGGTPGAPSAGSASNGPGGPIDAGSAGGGGVTAFKVLCGSSHIAPDDPIVHPNMPGMSHLPQFFGNRTTNARSEERRVGKECR